MATPPPEFMRIWRKSIALAHGLPVEHADMIEGTDLDTMAASAEALKGAVKGHDNRLDVDSAVLGYRRIGNPFLR